MVVFRSKKLFVTIALIILVAIVTIVPFTKSLPSKNKTYKLDKLKYYYENNSSIFKFDKDDSITRTLVVINNENNSKKFNLELNNIVNASNDYAYEISCKSYINYERQEPSDKNCNGVSPSLLFSSSKSNLGALEIDGNTTNVYNITIKNNGSSKALEGYLALNINNYYTLSGFVYANNKIVTGAKIEINNITSYTDDYGYFRINSLTSNDNRVMVSKNRSVIYDGDLSIKKSNMKVSISNSGIKNNSINHVIYNCSTNGGSCDIIPSDNSITLNNVATKEGYVFVGWNTDASAYEGLTSISLKKDTILYAIFKKELEATFINNSNGISMPYNSMKCNMYNNDESCIIKFPELTLIDNYELTGWSTGEKILLGEQIKIATNTEYNLNYKRKKIEYSVSFNANGTTLSDNENRSCVIDEVVNTDVQEDKCIVIPPKITRNTFNIIGFNTNKDETVSTPNYDLVKNELVLNKDNTGKTYYAISNKLVTLSSYRNNALSMTINDHEEKEETMLSESCIIYNDNTSCQITTGGIKGTKLTPVVIGWSKAIDDHEPFVKEKELISINENLSLYAQTSNESKILTIKFNGNGSKLSDGEDRTCETSKSYNGVSSVESCYVTPPTITRDTFEILGWNNNSSASDSTDKFQDSKIEVFQNETYYAITKKNVTVSFYLNNATYQKIGTKKYYDGYVNISCSIYNNGDSCTLVAPEIYKDNKRLKGYDTNNSSTVSSWNSKSAKSISNNASYYAIIG